MRFSILLYFALIPSLADADPSQNSFTLNGGVSNVAGLVIVMPGTEQERARSDMRYWIAMDSAIRAPQVFRIAAMEFESGASCRASECALSWHSGNRVNPGERLVIMAEEPITSITLDRSDGTAFVHYTTLQSPFESCVADATTRDIYVSNGGRNRNPTIAAIPLVSDPNDLVQYCVR